MKAILRQSVWLLPAGLVLLLDQLIKAYIRRTPYGHVSFRLPGVVEITHCANTGAAFSLLSGRTTLLTLLSLALIALLAVWLLRSMHLRAADKAALAILVGGGLGNAADRLCFGSVTDYIRLLMIDFPVFNFADVCITLSVAVLTIRLLKGEANGR